MKEKYIQWVFLLILALVLGGCASQPSAPVFQMQGGTNASEPQVTFTLQTAMMDGKMVYVGSGGTIDGIINPDLVIGEGDIFQIVLVNGDGMPHDLAVPDISVQMAIVSGKGQSVTATANAFTMGEYPYYCTVAGHRQAGMEGKLIVRESKSSD